MGSSAAEKARSPVFVELHWQKRGVPLSQSSSCFGIKYGACRMASRTSRRTRFASCRCWRNKAGERSIGVRIRRRAATTLACDCRTPLQRPRGARPRSMLQTLASREPRSGLALGASLSQRPRARHSRKLAASACSPRTARPPWRGRGPPRSEPAWFSACRRAATTRIDASALSAQRSGIRARAACRPGAIYSCFLIFGARHSRSACNGVGGAEENRMRSVQPVHYGARCVWPGLRVSALRSEPTSRATGRCARRRHSVLPSLRCSGIIAATSAVQPVKG